MIKGIEKFIARVIYGCRGHKDKVQMIAWEENDKDAFQNSNTGGSTSRYHEVEYLICVHCGREKRRETGEVRVYHFCDVPKPRFWDDNIK